MPPVAGSRTIAGPPSPNTATAELAVPRSRPTGVPVARSTGTRGWARGAGGRRGRARSGAPGGVARGRDGLWSARIVRRAAGRVCAGRPRRRRALWPPRMRASPALRPPMTRPAVTVASPRLVLEAGDVRAAYLLSPPIPGEPLVRAALRVLHAPTAERKAAQSDAAVALWRAGELTLGGEGDDTDTDPPSRPARCDDAVTIVPPYQIKRNTVMDRERAGAAGGGWYQPSRLQPHHPSSPPQSRLRIIHSLCHIESWAVDLAWDAVARWGRCEGGGGRNERETVTRTRTLRGARSPETNPCPPTHQGA